MDDLFWKVYPIYLRLETAPLVIASALFAAMIAVTAVLVVKTLKGRDAGDDR